MLAFLLELFNLVRFVGAVGELDLNGQVEHFLSHLFDGVGFQKELGNPTLGRTDDFSFTHGQDLLGSANSRSWCRLRIGPGSQGHCAESAWAHFFGSSEVVVHGDSP
ncbi:hypothetical protein D3C78_1510140 [compost metagenome]